MNDTSRMTQLLGAFRRERNGLVADTMHYEGTRYGLNYGVSLPTVRSTVRSMAHDHAFARYLYGQDVRCLKLAALHLAEPDRLTDPVERAFWWQGIVNSELAEEAAFAFVSRSAALPQLIEACADADNPLHLYMLLMAGARAPQPQAEWLHLTLAAVRSFETSPLIHLLARGLVALWAHLAEQHQACRNMMAETLSTLGHASWEEYLCEELSWRLML